MIWPLHTLECRWFYAGALDPGGPLVRAFRALRPVPAPDPVPPPDWSDPWRQDTYLVVGEADDVGMKWRGAEPGAPFEIKVRVGTLPWDEGRAERWMKWSYPDDQLPRALARAGAYRPGERQVVVRKNRLLRRIRLGPSGAHEEVGLHLFPDRRFEAELTRLEVGGAPFWTFGVEASPGDVDVPSEFVPLVAPFLELLSRETGPDRGPAQGYPAWLRQFIG